MLHRSGARAFHQELRAYEEVLPRLRGVPRLCSADASTYTLVVTTLPGERVDRLPAAERRAAHVQAGRWLRELHALDCPADDPLPLADALQLRAHSWVERAAQLDVDPALRARVSAAFTGALPATDRPRAWCHRDYAPYNWLVDGGRFQVIDFEHTRPDHPLVDLLRAPDREALLEGYGSPTGDEAELLDRLDLLHHLGTAVWEATHPMSEVSR